MPLDSKTYTYDMSEYGTFLISGTDAPLFISTMFTGNFQNCNVLFGSACGLLLNAQAQVIDVVYVICTGNNEYLMLTSKENEQEDFEWLDAHAKLKSDDNLVFQNLSFENQSGKLASLLIFGACAAQVYKFLTNACDGKVAYIATELKKDAYGVPSNEGYLLFVPFALAPEIGELLNSLSGVEMLNTKEFFELLDGQKNFCPQLKESKYYKPEELNLMYLVRDEKNFVGARFMKEE